MSRREHGFLLHEWLMVVLLSAVMMSAGITWGASLRGSLQARQWSQQMLISLNQLRQRALLEQQPWTLCATQDGHQCQNVWTGVWLVFVDADADGRRQATEVVASFLPAIPPRWRVVWRSFRSQPWLLWSAAGDASSSNGTLTLCPPTSQDAALRQLVISKSGRVRLVQPARSGATVLQAARSVCGWP